MDPITQPETVAMGHELRRMAERIEAVGAACVSGEHSSTGLYIDALVALSKHIRNAQSAALALGSFTEVKPAPDNSPTHYDRCLWRIDTHFHGLVRCSLARGHNGECAM